MREIEFIRFIENQLSEMDGSNVALTALGMIEADISEYGFEPWANMPAVKVVEGHLEATEVVAEDLLEDIETMIGQEKQIESLGVEQSMRIDTIEVLKGFSSGLIDVFKSLILYFLAQEQAKIFMSNDTH